MMWSLGSVGTKHCFCLMRWHWRPDLVQSQDGLDAFMQEVCLPKQTAAVKGHQLLVEVHGEHIEVYTTLNGLSLSEGHRAEWASCRRGKKESQKLRPPRWWLNTTWEANEPLADLVCNCPHSQARRAQGRQWPSVIGSLARTRPRHRGRDRRLGTVVPPAEAAPLASIRHRLKKDIGYFHKYLTQVR